MNETSFIIRDLDNGWVWQDIVDEHAAYAYCEEELEIPDEKIEDLECYDDAIRVCLTKDKAYTREDWYVNLQRVGKSRLRY